MRLPPFFSLAVFSDPELHRRARILFFLVLVQNLIAVLLATVAYLSEPGYTARLLLVAAFGVVSTVGLLAIVRTGRVSLAATLNSASWFVFVVYLSATAGGIHAPILSGFLYLIIATGVILNTGAAAIVGALAIIASGAISFLGARGLLPLLVRPSPAREWIVYSAVVLLVFLVLALSLRTLVEALGKAKAEIGERIRAEDALRQSNEHRRAFTEASFDGLNIIDDGRILDANERSAEMFGYSPGELTGMDSLDLMAPQDRERGRMLRSEVAPRAELSGLRKDGSTFPIEIRRRPLRYAGKDVHVLAVRDLTHEKLEEASRKAAEDQYRNLFSLVQEIVFGIDEGGHVRTLNPAFERVTGLHVEDCIGRPFTELLHPDDHERAIDTFRVQAEPRDGLPDIVVEPDPEVREFRIRRADGNYLVAEIVSTVIRTHGQLTSVLGIARDVTERRTLAEQVQRMQRLDMLGALAGGIAHDLNNVFSPILTAAQLLRSSSTTEGDAEILTILDRAARRGSEIVRQILTFARGQSNETAEFSLTYPVKEMVSVMGKTFPKNIAIVTDIPKDLWFIEGNATQLSQVIMNLGLNARDAMDHGGTLTITAVNRRTSRDRGMSSGAGRLGDGGAESVASEARFVELEITDTGSGIPEAILPNIFDPFFTTKDREKGTGLGLSMVSTIVREHHGTISVTTKPGSGTTFRLTFPAVVGGAEQASAAQVPVPRGAGERILVVDDEMSILQICRETLEVYGYRVTASQSSAEAVTIIAGEPAGAFALLLTDLNMPNLDGTTLAATVARMDPEIGVVLMSGTYTESIHGAPSASRPPVSEPVPSPGANHRARVDAPIFLPKPFSAEELARAVAGALGIG